MEGRIDLALVEPGSSVGQELLRLLAERRLPGVRVRAVGRSPAPGSYVDFGDDELPVEDLDSFDFSAVQLALFAPLSGATRDVIRAAAAGCLVIDSNPGLRRDPEVPLVVPEVNPDALAHCRLRGIVSSPGSATVPLVMALKPLHEAAGIVRVNVATYQSVSVHGPAGVEALAAQAGRALNGIPYETGLFPKPIAFNVLPQVQEFEDNGYTREELGLAAETARILEDEGLRVNATCVQVPMFYGQAMAVHVETRQKLGVVEARRLLTQMPGVQVLDERRDGGYPTPVTETAEQDLVFVGRIREDLSHPRGLNLWIVADNVRRGGALNVIGIAERLVAEHLGGPIDGGASAPH